MPRYIDIKRGPNTLRLNADTVGQMLNSKELAGVLTQYAEQKRQTLGDGYAVEQQKTKDRERINIKTDSEKAVQDNLDNNTLLKAVGK